MITPRVIVSNPPRGPGKQPAAEFYLSRFEFADAWGAEPASAVCTYVRETVANESVRGNGVSLGALVRIELLDAVWLGVCVEDKSVDTSGGKDRTLVFKDLRELLKWDYVFGQFNMEERRLQLNQSTGRTEWMRTYWHVLPGDWRRRKVYRTLEPIPAARILELLQGAPTVQSPWVFRWHDAQWSYPLLNLDFSRGVRLDGALTQIAQSQGLTFRQSGYFELVFGRKGELLAGESFPVDIEGRYVFDTDLDDDAADGLAIGEAPTRVFVAGDRNVYQVFNVGLEPDWNRAWEQFYDPALFIDHVFRNVDHSSGVKFSEIAGDVEQVIGWQMAAARASEMTVGEFARLFGESVWADARKFQGRCRMDMPAMLYITQLLFRAFRPPYFISIAGTQRETRDMELASRMLMPVRHNPLNGVMYSDGDQPLEGNGYVVVKGYQVGQSLFESLEPGRVRLSLFASAQDVWSAAPFTIDDNGDAKMVILETAAIRSGDLLANVNGQAVFRARPTFTVPQVKATLTFLGENFLHTVGSGVKDGVVNEPGLYSEYLTDAAHHALQELPYSDGLTATQKAQQLGEYYLARSWIERSGGFTRRLTVDGSIVRLNGLYDRVVVRCSEGGFDQTVDFTSARGDSAFVPMQRYERAVVGASLFPGQAELQQNARTMRSLAAGLAASPGYMRRELWEAFRGAVGSRASLRPVVISGGSGFLHAGTPLWKTPSAATTVEEGGVVEERVTNTRAVMPSASGDGTKEFVGVTVRDGENAAGVVNVQRGGVVLARVRGPASFGDVVGRVNGADYLAENEDEDDVTAKVGRALQDVPANVVQLIKVVVGVGEVAEESGGFTWIS